MSQDVQLDLSGDPQFIFSSESSKKPVHLILKLESKKDAGTKNDLLYRALGKEKNSGKKLLDVTAGLLRDSVHMASLGYQVTAVEKNPLLFQGMNALLERQPQANLKLFHADAFEFLNSTNEFFDIIYLDPMFPESSGSALSGKEAQLLQLLAGHGDESENEKLLELAISKAKERVLIKRPRKSELLKKSPTFQTVGQSTRYDVYKIR